jgi:hypothetical protein
VINLGSDTCFLALGVNEDFWALGMTMLRGYYVTFDVGNDQVGFVPQDDSGKSELVYDPAVPDSSGDTNTNPVPVTPNDRPVEVITSWQSQLISMLFLIVMLLLILWWMQQKQKIRELEAELKNQEE